MQTVTGINPDVLKWARETAGRSVDEVAQALKKAPDVIQAWESGGQAPTYAQLEKLAYQLYRRPMALFFFSEVPEEIQPSQSFRTLPAEDLETLSADTRLALRDAHAMQLSLYELNDNVNPAPRAIFRDLRLGEKAPVIQAVGRVRGYLGLDLKEQASWRSAHVAVKRWRERVEDVGLFVFKRPMKQKDISGFCLLDDEFPVICLNNSTPHTRQAFSLFHELAHVLLGTNGVTKRDDSYIKLLSPRFGSIEVFCNRFAAEFLLPSEAFSAFLGEDFHNDSIVRTIAEKFHVSREVVLRRALDAGLVDAEHYQQKASEWASQADLARRSRPGGDYYASQATYLGSRFLQLAFSRYYQGRCTREQLAEHLNVKVDTLTGLETFATVGGHH